MEVPNTAKLPNREKEYDGDLALIVGFISSCVGTVALGDQSDRAVGDAAHNPERDSSEWRRAADVGDCLGTERDSDRPNVSRHFDMQATPVTIRG